MIQHVETLFADILADSKDGEWGQGQEAGGYQLAEVIRGTDFAELNKPGKELPKRWIKNHLVERKKLLPGDLVFETAGGTATQSTGRSALLRKSFFERHKQYPVLCSSFSRHLRLKTDEYCPEFVYYLLQALYKSGYMGVYNLQHTGVSRFQYTTFKNKTVLKLPRRKTQQKIAALLSVYDDLIENNRRRIALLEKMAEEIYREWFVRMRFPGHEKVTIIRGVPDGWQVLPFTEIVNINPTERIDKSDELHFAGMDDLSLTSMFFTTKETRKGGQGAKFRNRDVLFPRITPSVENGKRGFVMTLEDGHVGFGSTEFIVMREKVIGPEHIYFLTCSSEFRRHAELSMTGASGRQRVQEECFSFFLVKTPPSEIRRQFSDVVGPHFIQIKGLSLQTERLIRMRDFLLPRLISGKLSIENFDIKFPLSMQDEIKNAEKEAACA